ncbi:8-amino-7-oxononanoate synthase [Tautonia marina]|uniref:8-amino-7-oxononanoate synthase n=1 Tax=Tautonia marina TaxID=2653855 RepID=UPI0012606DDE|nr:8-amino-7-oxononanoate synthase [Tautonia marina]
MSFDPLAWLDEVADHRNRMGLHRSIVPYGTATPGWLERDGQRLVDLSSNDYLGLASDPRVIAAGMESARRYGWGSGASPLVCGWREPHQRLAEDLAAFERTEAVALFPTGYAANLGTIAALVGSGDVVYGDRLNHSCLIQGARLSGASVRIFPHGDHERLAHLIGRDQGRYRRTLIATDGVFSMDGDLAPLSELVEIAERSGSMLLVDEAHGTGVFGPEGRGASAALGVADRVAIRVGTLSKALGSVGGFVAGSRRLIDHLNNHAPTLLYSTATPPAAAGAAREALRIIREEPWRRERVHQLGRRLRDGLRSVGLKVPESEGPIVPVILGDVDRTLNAASRLLASGFLVGAIRPPTVARGTARLRISLAASHDEEQLDRLIEEMESVCLPAD